MNRFAITFLAILIGLAAKAEPSVQVQLVGNVPDHEIANLQVKLDKIWQHELATYLRTDHTPSAPEIGFFAFQHDGESTDWQAWQKDWIRDNPSIWLDWTTISGVAPQALTSDWIDAHIDTIFPFPATFLAFHYDHTNRIQISPATTFLRFYQNDAYGVKRDTTGYGFYVSSHEMLHDMLENNGVAPRLHHCIFVTEKNSHTLMGDLTEFLIREQISAPIIRNVGLQAEESMRPCDQLTDDEKSQVKQYMDKFDFWN